MELSELHEMVNAYQESLKEEFLAKSTLADLQTDARTIEVEIVAAGYADGKIDGKNAETRKAQTDALLAAHERIVAVNARIRLADTAATVAEIERKSQESLIGLVKAWLYSQSGH